MGEWLKSGHYIGIWNEVKRVFEYFQLTSEETLTSYIFGQGKDQFGEVASDGESDFKEVEDMEPAEGHIYQVLFGVRTACIITVDVPSGVSIWGTDERKRSTTDYRYIAYVDQDLSPFEDPAWETELFFIKNFYPWLNAFNPTTKSLNPEVRFVGKMFVYEQVVDPELLDKLERRVVPYRPITLGVLPGKGRKK